MKPSVIKQVTAIDVKIAKNDEYQKRLEQALIDAEKINDVPLIRWVLIESEDACGEVAQLQADRIRLTGKQFYWRKQQ